MGKLTHSPELPVSLAVWLSYDEYDYVDKENYISVTNLLKPTKQAVLAHRVKQHPVFKDKKIDVLSFFASRLGTAIHNSIEKTWDTNPQRFLRMLGYPEKVADDIVVFNESTGLPSAKELSELRSQGKIIVAQEIRMYRKFGDYIIGGKIDFVFDGVPEDFKTVKTWAYGDKDKEEKELMQISMYRWLNPDLITSDTGKISQIFLDWIKGRAKNANYPPLPIVPTTHKLHSLENVEKFIGNKIAELERCAGLEEKDLPKCTAQDLWKNPNTYKYYTTQEQANNPKSRSKKNFNSYMEAEKYRLEQGKGVIKMVEGQVKACNYCPGFELCQQKEEYLAAGILVTEE